MICYILSAFVIHASESQIVEHVLFLSVEIWGVFGSSTILITLELISSLLLIHVADHTLITYQSLTCGARSLVFAPQQGLWDPRKGHIKTN